MEERGLIVRVPELVESTPAGQAQRVGSDRGETQGRAVGRVAAGFRSVIDAGWAEPQRGRTAAVAFLDDGAGADSRPVGGSGQEKLQAALEHWKKVERTAAGDGVSFLEGMRLLSGADLAGTGERQRRGRYRVGRALRGRSGCRMRSNRLRAPQETEEAQRRAAGGPASVPADRRRVAAFRRPPGLGACLADDMGLGKTIQVIALLLDLKSSRPSASAAAKPACRAGVADRELESGDRTVRADAP